MAVFLTGAGVLPVLGVPISDYAVGSSVFIPVNGVSTEFLVVQQGKPSSVYDDSCDGTWLITKNAYTNNQVWDASDHDYANSDTHSYLNNTFLGLFDEDLQQIIKQVKIPYRKGVGTGKTATTGANGLSTKAFLLSYAEAGLSGNSYAPIEGAGLSYFNSNSRRIAYFNGSAVLWSLRTPFTNTANVGNTMVFGVSQTGTSTTHRCYNNGYSTRPCIILPYDTLVNPKTNEVKA